MTSDVPWRNCSAQCIFFHGSRRVSGIQMCWPISEKHGNSELSLCSYTSYLYVYDAWLMDNADLSMTDGHENYECEYEYALYSHSFIPFRALDASSLGHNDHQASVHVTLLISLQIRCCRPSHIAPKQGFWIGRISTVCGPTIKQRPSLQLARNDWVFFNGIWFPPRNEVTVWCHGPRNRLVPADPQSLFQAPSASWPRLWQPRIFTNTVV